ncbi:hypothetical protein EXIGLDRAFT_49774 [Exidia glandulosa HHB12029]|uniref:Uncharacterized protein n=1 Tax=Exidia glandulosa HHB12029 TaxID=1314781 RepID=A0A165IG81_EXIGL|nr:hypothetical protein EXIGLDRAFT_49774 [Exidia glandulosa HHB12029]
MGVTCSSILNSSTCEEGSHVSEMKGVGERDVDACSEHGNTSFPRRQYATRYSTQYCRLQTFSTPSSFVRARPRDADSPRLKLRQHLASNATRVDRMHPVLPQHVRMNRRDKKRSALAAAGRSGRKMGCAVPAAVASFEFPPNAKIHQDLPGRRLGATIRGHVGTVPAQGPRHRGQQGDGSRNVLSADTKGQGTSYVGASGNGSMFHMRARRAYTRRARGCRCRCDSKR